nr:T9SS type A sorting domain-containing protein [Rhodohalobacter sp. 614A]
MGDPGATDTFRFVDTNGTTVGNEVQVALGDIDPVGESIWAFFDPGTFQYTASQPGNSNPAENTRAIRLRVFDLADFGLNASNVDDVTTFVHILGGQSDVAFVGSYNENTITFVLSDLEITKEISPTGPVSSGNTITFIVEVTNNGPSDATNVVVEDQLPSGYTYQSDNSGGSYNSLTGEWNIGSLANGASETLEIVAVVNASGNYENSATVTGDESDPNQLNNTDTASLASVSLELTGGPCWRMLSSPVDGLTYAEMLDGLWTQGVAGAEYEQGDSNVFVWNNTVSDNESGWIAPTTLNQEITPGTGFLISVFADDDYDGPEKPEDPFAKTISLLGAAHQGDVTPPMNDTNGGWTLVGNPYANPISFSALTTDQLTGAAYVYDRNYNGTGGWRSTDTENYGDLIDGAIASGQGFFVQNNGDGSLTFTEATQTTGGQFYGKKNELRDFVRLEVRGPSGVNSLWIRFSDRGSEERVYGDAIELQPLSEEYALFASRKVDGTLSDIGHFPMPTEEINIPVSVQATQPGTYSISATDLDIPVGTELYLYDQHTGESVPITSSLDYSFTLLQQEKTSPDTEGIVPCTATPQQAKTTVAADRFLITTLQNNSTSELPEDIRLKQNFPNPFNPSTIISYELPQSSTVRLEIFDMIGRQVATLVDGMIEAGEHQVNFDASHLTSGIYLYRLTAIGSNGSQQVFTRKLTVVK